MQHRTTLLMTGLCLLGGWAVSLAHPQSTAYPDVEIGPNFTASGELRLPQGFRKWVFIGSPLTPHGLNGGNAGFPEFHNVYVEPAAYDHYVEHGVWPEGTMMVKELQLTQPGTFPDGSRVEVSGRGYFPGVTNGMDVSVKDSKRFADTKGWGFFNFGHHAAPYAESAAEAPVDACAGCHMASAHEDMVFTGFYQLLQPLASQHSAMRPSTDGTDSVYTLYYLPGASSLAIHAVLRELGQPVNLIERDSTYDFLDLNPVGAVPVLIDDDLVIREGAAILLHLLDKHENTLLPKSGTERTQALESMMFANATLHAAYRRLFFVQDYMLDEPIRTDAFDAAIQWVERLWAIVDRRIGIKPFLDGNQVSAADFLLAVYARWNTSLPTPIRLGANTARMVERVTGLPAFQQALAAETPGIPEP